MKSLANPLMMQQVKPFDKTAKLLGLDYPGGAALSRLAEKGIADRFGVPRPMTDRPGLDFSFSGLKPQQQTPLIRRSNKKVN